MLEPDVTLSDFALAAECAVFCWVLIRREPGTLQMNRLFALLFAALGASSLLGGLWHGVFSGDQTEAGRWVWFGCMAALAFAAVAIWHIAAALAPPWLAPGPIRALAWGQLAAQLGILAFVSHAFAIGPAGLAPPVLLLMALYLSRYRTAGDGRLLAGFAGLALAMVPGLVIFFGVSLHPLWASTNTLYHACQFVAFWLVFLSVPGLRAQTG
ncbi:DUF6962 family protein [Aestuariicoccus sp. MJ-SS9]|uniref:DUF6962 family protein n=1 Tax=Aestuariicoccus sp. MJ-SS9 TaxID=3079855 RepID=UPI0029135E7F|nr:hypothetical protein [Aestuariicoccus sp. MJ-SS9]MDU8911436.1 hypothetical protein [Aestuariicoccus sp. MJ-SS9]